jgi:hypothetical protein
VKIRKKPTTQMTIVLSLGIANSILWNRYTKNQRKIEKGKEYFINEETGPVVSGPVKKA